MDNLNMDSHNLDDSGNEQSFVSRLMENQNARLAAALAVGLIVGSGATWASLRTDAPKKPKAVVEQRHVENRATPVQSKSSSTASKRATTKPVSLKVALKNCNKITNKNKRAACITRAKKTYANRTNSATTPSTSKTTSTRG